MRKSLKVVLCSILIMLLWGTATSAEVKPSPTTTTTTTIIISSNPPSFFLTQSTVPRTARPKLKCFDRRELIRYVSDGKKIMYKVDYIMHRESRCRQMAFNPTDPNGGSYGLFQINGYWCNPSRYSKIGWLQERGVLDKCTDLYNPLINAKAFMLMYDYAGWQPWGGEPWN